jgi:hypothetical protein
MIMSTILVTLVAIAVILPTIAHAMFISVSNGYADGSVSGNTIMRGGTTTVVGTNSNGQLTVTTVDSTSNGYTVTTTTYNAHAQPVSQTTITASKGQTFTTTNTYTTQTITKTYTQYIYDTYVVDHYIYYYMYPVLNWVFTLTNIGQLQAPGYHNVGNEKLFLPGFGGGSGIFVPVFAQEAVYVFNIAPSTKPQITGWYTGSTSQSSSGPFLVSQSSTPPQLTSIQETVNTIQQQASFTVPNISKTTTYWNYNTQSGNNNTIILTPKPYYYSPQDIAVAYLTGNIYETQAVSDLLNGNIIGAAQSFGTALYNYGKGIYEQAWNFYAGVVSTLFNTVTSPNNPWSVAHALSIGNIIGAAGTVFSNGGQALSNGWNQAMGWFNHL